jgi:hypothetical protein
MTIERWGLRLMLAIPLLIAALWYYDAHRPVQPMATPQEREHSARCMRLEERANTVAGRATADDARVWLEIMKPCTDTLPVQTTRRGR